MSEINEIIIRGKLMDGELEPVISLLRSKETLIGTRKLTMSPGIMCVIADYLEGKIQKPSGRPRSFDSICNLLCREHKISKSFFRLRKKYDYNVTMLMLLSRYGSLSDGGSACSKEKVRLGRKSIEAIICRAKKEKSYYEDQPQP